MNIFGATRDSRRGDLSSPPPSRTIPWHRRLEARVLVGVTLIAGLTLASSTVVTSRVVRSHSLERARGDLAAAQAAFAHLITTRADVAVAQTRLITALPVFRAYMTDSQLANDRATMETMADTYRHDLSAAFCIVTSNAGQWLASPGVDASMDARAVLQPVIDQAAAGQPTRRILAFGPILLLVVSEPARFGAEVLGTLTTAYRLDDTVARDLARITRGDVALLANGRISGASFDTHVRNQIATLVQPGASHFGQIGEVALRDIGGTPYVGGIFSLGDTTDTSDASQLVLLEPWQATEQFIDDITHQLLWTGAIVFVLAIGVSLVLARRMSRPLRAIADVAGEIASGHWDRRVPGSGSAEAMVMAKAFNDMTSSLSHWHAEARHQTDQVQEAYDRYAAVTDSAHDAIVSTDANGSIVFWNRSAETIFGLGHDDAIGLPLASWLEPNCRDAFSRALAGIAQGDAGQEARTFEGDGRRHSDTTFPLELSLASWRVGASVYVTAIIRDITERKGAADALRQREEQLRQAQKMEAIGRLASGVAHDFNNALAVIHGYTEQLMFTMRAHDECQEDLSEILKASESAAALTRQLLAFSRKQALDLRVISPVDVIANIQNMLRRLVGSEIELITEFDEHAGTVRADRGQLEQVAINLTVNARDAMPAGGRIVVSISRTSLSDAATCTRLGIAPGDYVTLSVADTGHGMDAVTARQIFEPFFTTKEEGKGTGLGLSTVYGIVTQNGGAIDLETAPGRGTTFRIHLPQRAETETGDDEPEVLRETNGGRETVLLVEDDAAVRTIVRKALSSAGYSVLEAESGLDALALVDSHAATIRLVLTDIMMPGMNGHALAQELPAIAPDAQVLFMSGHAADVIGRDGFDPTAVRFLQKPFTTQALLDEVRATLDATVVSK